MILEELSIERDLFHGSPIVTSAIMFSITASCLAKPVTYFVAMRATNNHVEYRSAKHHEVYFNIVLQESVTASFVMQHDIGSKSNPPFRLEFLILDYCKR